VSHPDIITLLPVCHDDIVTSVWPEADEQAACGPAAHRLDPTTRSQAHTNQTTLKHYRNKDNISPSPGILEYMEPVLSLTQTHHRFPCKLRDFLLFTCSGGQVTFKK
jgi:hypothetical protein